MRHLSINMLILSITFFILPICAVSQKKLQNYIIITFEEDYNIAKWDKKTYYWIIPQDSIRLGVLNLSPLFLNGFSEMDLDKCCKGIDFDPLTITTIPSYDFDSLFYKDLEVLRSLLKRGRVIQKIVKKWSIGTREVVTVYATPIRGIFCSSNYHITGQVRFGYKGSVYLPVSSFMYLKEFWESEAAHFTLNYDYYKLKSYSILY